MGVSKEIKNFHAASNLQALYLNDSTADIHFEFETDGVVQKLGAHRCILAIGSPVFQKMFFGDLSEGNSVRIIDATVDAFIEFLQYFYLEKITLDSESIEEVMTLADKYDVAGCMNLCAQFLELTLETSTAAWCYELALSFHLNYVAGICEERICLETKDVLKTDAFLNCTQSTLRAILNMEHLSCSELTIFEECLAWAATACKRAHEDHTSMANQKKQLGECFYLIRFPAMSTEDFSKCAELEGLLDPTETLDILKYLTLHQNLQVATKYPQKLRKGAPAWTKDDIVFCDRRTQLQLSRTAHIDRDVVAFAVNECILVGQISISAFKSADESHSGDNRAGILTVRRGGNGQVIHTQTVHISSISHNKIQLTKPFIVQPFEDYEIETEWQLEPTDQLILRTHCKSEVMLEGGIRFQFKKRGDVKYDNVSEGLIAKIYFKIW